LPGASGGFSLSLDYGNLNFVNYGIGSAWGPVPIDFSADDGSGTVDFFVLADTAVLEPDLYALQNSGSFTLAHVDFTGVAAGDFTLGLRNVAVSNFLGEANDPAFNLLVCSGAACGASDVPEPMTPLLVAAALGGLALSRRQKAA
jgi:hypothetical protein